MTLASHEMARVREAVANPRWSELPLFFIRHPTHQARAQVSRYVIAHIQPSAEDCVTTRKAAQRQASVRGQVGGAKVGFKVQ